MLHYDLVDKNSRPIILEEKRPKSKPLFGLIESCYNDIDFLEYFSKLYTFSQRLEKQLLACFNINRKIFIEINSFYYYR